MIRTCVFALLTTAAVLVGLTDCTRAAQAQTGPAEQTKFFVEYTRFAQYPNGIVKREGSGRVGPFLTRREAQSTCDWYLGQDYRSGNVRYYYSARVI